MTTLVWLVFAGVVTGAVVFDLAKHRHAAEIRSGEAVRWSVFWLALGLGFAGLLAVTHGRETATAYTAAYLLEKSLAVDNLLVFALIFSYFRVPAAYQHRVLFYGVLGALVFRGVLLAAGVALVDAFTWVLFLFAAMLIWSSIKLLRHDEEQSFDPGHSGPVRLLRRLLPVTDDYVGQRFLVRRSGRLAATPLLAVVVAIEAADLAFAVDSVPAVLGVSDDLLVVYTSNALAILGLRALYFCLASLLRRFAYLNKGLAVLLAFIGAKLVLEALAHEVDGVPTIPVGISLAVIGAVLGGSVLASLLWPPQADGDRSEPLAPRERPERNSVEIPSVRPGEELACRATIGSSERQEER